MRPRQACENLAGRPRVLLDVDGVLGDFTSRALETVARVTGRCFVPADVTHFDFCAALKLSADEERAVKRGIGETAGFCESIKPYPDARRGVAELIEIADVYVVTSPWNSNATWTHEREAWLHRHFAIGAARVIHCSCKHLIDGDIFVDDKASAVDAWKAARPGLAIHWQNLHNQHEPSQLGVRCSDWGWLVAAVKEVTA